MKQLALLSAIYAVIALSACTATSNPLAPSHAANDVTVGRPSGDALADQSAKNLIFVTSTNGEHVYEYRSNQTTSKPLHSFLARQGFIGVDGAGYSYFTNQPDLACNSPCIISLYDVNGAYKRKITFNTLQYPYVDRAGSIYGVANDCHQIEQFPAGAKGAPAPIRSINISRSYCNLPPKGFDFTHWRLAADDRGRIYFLSAVGMHRKEQKLLIWAPGAKGNARPARKIVNPYMRGGIQAVLSNGSVWFVGDGPALLFGPTANGQVSPQMVKLSGGDPFSLLASTTGQLIYLTPSACAIQIGPRGSGPVVHSIPLMTDSCYGSLWGTTL